MTPSRSTDAVADQPHRAGHEVGALVPLGRAGAGVRPAPLAGAESGLLRGGGARVEAHVLRLRRHHRTAGPAVDLGGQHRGEEPAVEARVLRLDGPQAPLHVLVHVPKTSPPASARLAEKRHGDNPGRWRRISASQGCCQNCSQVGKACGSCRAKSGSPGRLTPAPCAGRASASTRYQRWNLRATKNHSPSTRR